jgi:predicted short-subunit dehydrogenase-like oxidoreductase (DUF2520 family)
MKVSLIGSGNLATQLGIALYEKGHPIVQVWSRTAENAAELAIRLNCQYTNDLSLINSDSDIYVVSVADKAIKQVLSGRFWGNKLVVHTSGSTPIELLSPYCENFGVFYPFQTFSKAKNVDFDLIPICLEANTPQNLEILRDLAQSISSNVQLINSEQRQQIHLAAVFACNFVNHFYSIGEELLREKGIGFDILKPLILETAAKIVGHSPESVQTGPAIRNDKDIIIKHLILLKNQPDLQTIYQQISDRIIQTIN